MCCRGHHLDSTWGEGETGELSIWREKLSTVVVGGFCDWVLGSCLGSCFAGEVVLSVAVETDVQWTENLAKWWWMMNRNGPRTEPWGTPEVTGGLRGEGIELDELVARWDVNGTQWGVCDRLMEDCCLLRNLVWEILSRATVRSRRMRMVRVEFRRNVFFHVFRRRKEGWTWGGD